MAGVPFKVCIPSRSVQVGIVARNYEHFREVLAAKFGLESCRVTLKDGTLICDEDYFELLEPQTVLTVTELDARRCQVGDKRAAPVHSQEPCKKRPTVQPVTTVCWRPVPHAAGRPPARTPATLPVLELQGMLNQNNNSSADLISCLKISSVAGNVSPPAVHTSPQSQNLFSQLPQWNNQHPAHHSTTQHSATQPVTPKLTHFSSNAAPSSQHPLRLQPIPNLFSSPQPTQTSVSQQSLTVPSHNMPYSLQYPLPPSTSCRFYRNTTATEPVVPQAMQTVPPPSASPYIFTPQHVPSASFQCRECSQMQTHRYPALSPAPTQQLRTPSQPTATRCVLLRERQQQQMARQCRVQAQELQRTRPPVLLSSPTIGHIPTLSELIQPRARHMLVRPIMPGRAIPAQSVPPTLRLMQPQAEPQGQPPVVHHISTPVQSASLPSDPPPLAVVDCSLDNCDDTDDEERLCIAEPATPLPSESDAELCGELNSTIERTHEPSRLVTVLSTKHLQPHNKASSVDDSVVVIDLCSDVEEDLPDLMKASCAEPATPLPSESDAELCGELNSTIERTHEPSRLVTVLSTKHLQPQNKASSVDDSVVVIDLCSDVEEDLPDPMKASCPSPVRSLVSSDDGYCSGSLSGSNIQHRLPFADFDSDDCGIELCEQSRESVTAHLSVERVKEEESVEFEQRQLEESGCFLSAPVESKEPVCLEQSRSAPGSLSAPDCPKDSLHSSDNQVAVGEGISVEPDDSLHQASISDSRESFVVKIPLEHTLECLHSRYRRNPGTLAPALVEKFLQDMVALDSECCTQEMIVSIPATRQASGIVVTQCSTEKEELGMELETESEFAVEKNIPVHQSDVQPVPSSVPSQLLTDADSSKSVVVQDYASEREVLTTPLLPKWNDIVHCSEDILSVLHGSGEGIDNPSKDFLVLNHEDHVGNEVVVPREEEEEEQEEEERGKELERSGVQQVRLEGEIEVKVLSAQTNKPRPPPLKPHKLQYQLSEKISHMLKQSDLLTVQDSNDIQNFFSGKPTDPRRGVHRYLLKRLHSSRERAEICMEVNYMSGKWRALKLVT